LRQLKQDPHEALPCVAVTSRRMTVQHNARMRSLDTVDKDQEAWNAQRDLLSSDSRDSDFVVEIDNEQRAHLRFGDGLSGRCPEVDTRFVARYRIGNGSMGNVGADTITRCVRRDTGSLDTTLRPRNPLPAQGGTDPESLAQVKLLAPRVIAKPLQRAITADDYARLAERDDKIQRAAATLCWTGSWYEVQVTVDPLGAEEADPNWLNAVRGRLQRYRRMGHDLAVAAARYVALDIELTVCVLPHYLRGDVKAALLDVLGSRVRHDGTLGLFHADNLTFGGQVTVSRLVAAAQAVPGVESLRVTRLRRFGDTDRGELDAGILRLNPLEIARLDNDPSSPEHGRLTLVMRGGR
jgi:predicted phage baseplate assembly protein